MEARSWFFNFLRLFIYLIFSKGIFHPSYMFELFLQADWFYGSSADVRVSVTGIWLLGKTHQGGAISKKMEFLEELSGFKMTSIFPQHSPPSIALFLFFVCFPLTKYETEPNLRLPHGDGLNVVRKVSEQVPAGGAVLKNSEVKTWKALHRGTAKNDAMHQVHAKILTPAKTREHMYIPLEWIEDIINAIAYYSILRNATAHMHKMFLT